METYQQIVYEVAPLSRNDLRGLAYRFREQFKIKSINFPVMKFLEFVCPNIGLYCRPYDESEWSKRFSKSVQGSYDVETNLIELPEKIYDAACQGNGFARMTVMHEICHAILLRGKKIKVYRNTSKKVLPYCDPEWQAKCLAAEIMIPYADCKNMSAEEIQKVCGVTYSAARYQIEKFKL